MKISRSIHTSQRCVQCFTPERLSAACGTNNSLNQRRLITGQTFLNSGKFVSVFFSLIYRLFSPENKMLHDPFEYSLCCIHCRFRISFVLCFSFSLSRLLNSVEDTVPLVTGSSACRRILGNAPAQTVIILRHHRTCYNFHAFLARDKPTRMRDISRVSQNRSFCQLYVGTAKEQWGPKK